MLQASIGYNEKSYLANTIIFTQIKPINIILSFELLTYVVVKQDKFIFMFNDSIIIMGNQNFGGYTTVLKLGKGLYGKTRVCQTPDGFYLALKMVEVRAGMSKQMMSKDIRHLDSLKLSGIAHLKDIVDIDQNKLGIVTEYYDEGNLSIHLQKRVVGDELIQMRRIAEIIQGLHNLKIIHRDIRPENIFFKEGAIFVSDVGVLSVITGCRIREFEGCYDYRAPQTFEGNYSYASDVWSLAVVFLQILHGKRIRQMMNLVGILKPQQINIQYPSQDILLAIENQNLRYLLTYMLEPEPSKRININDVILCLRDLYGKDLKTYRKEALNQNKAELHDKFISKEARPLYLTMSYSSPYIKHFDISNGTIRRIDRENKRYQIFSRESIPAGRWEINAKVIKYGDGNDEIVFGLLTEERKSERSSGDIDQPNSVAYWSNVVNQKGHLCENGIWRDDVLPCLRENIGNFKMVIDTIDNLLQWYIDGKLRGISNLPMSYWDKELFVFVGLMGFDCTVKFMQKESLN